MSNFRPIQIPSELRSNLASRGQTARIGSSGNSDAIPRTPKRVRIIRNALIEDSNAALSEIHDDRDRRL